MTTFLLLMSIVANASPPPPPPLPRAFCDAATGDDARSVTHLRARYGVIGTNGSGVYSGELTLSGSEDAEFLDVSGEVAGERRDGTARIIRCGADRIRQLEVTWKSGAVLFCVPHGTFDNARKASCSRDLGGRGEHQELWFERLGT